MKSLLLIKYIGTANVLTATINKVKNKNIQNDINFFQKFNVDQNKKRIKVPFYLYQYASFDKKKKNSTKKENIIYSFYIELLNEINILNQDCLVSDNSTNLNKNEAPLVKSDIQIPMNTLFKSIQRSYPKNAKLSEQKFFLEDFQRLFTTGFYSGSKTYKFLNNKKNKNMNLLENSLSYEQSQNYSLDITFKINDIKVENINLNTAENFDDVNFDFNFEKALIKNDNKDAKYEKFFKSKFFY